VLTLPRTSFAYFDDLEPPDDRGREGVEDLEGDLEARLLSMVAVRAVATRFEELAEPDEDDRFFARFEAAADEEDDDEILAAAAGRAPAGATTLWAAARAASGTLSSSSSLRRARHAVSNK